MAAAVSLPPAPPQAPEEQRIVLYGVSWKDYLIIRDVLDGPSPRMTYLEGALELMSPSTSHEEWKKNIARLVELYAHRAQIDLFAYGGATFRREARERGAEPDECYVVGRELVDYPDIVVEVVHTAPLLDKRAVYAGMGVAELWVFKGGAFKLYGLDAKTETYVERGRSTFLPGLDFERLAAFAVRPMAAAVLREFEALISP